MACKGDSKGPCGCPECRAIEGEPPTYGQQEDLKEMENIAAFSPKRGGLIVNTGAQTKPYVPNVALEATLSQRREQDGTRYAGTYATCDLDVLTDTGSLSALVGSFRGRQSQLPITAERPAGSEVGCVFSRQQIAASHGLLRGAGGQMAPLALPPDPNFGKCRCWGDKRCNIPASCCPYVVSSYITLVPIDSLHCYDPIANYADDLGFKCPHSFHFLYMAFIAGSFRQCEETTVPSRCPRVRFTFIQFAKARLTRAFYNTYQRESYYRDRVRLRRPSCLTINTDWLLDSYPGVPYASQHPPFSIFPNEFVADYLLDCPAAELVTERDVWRTISLSGYIQFRTYVAVQCGDCSDPWHWMAIEGRDWEVQFDAHVPNWRELLRRKGFIDCSDWLRNGSVRDRGLVNLVYPCLGVEWPNGGLLGYPDRDKPRFNDFINDRRNWQLDPTYCELMTFVEELAVLRQNVRVERRSGW